MEEQIAEIVKFLKKNTQIRGESVALTAEGETDVPYKILQVGLQVTAKMNYKVGGLNEDNEVAAKQDTKAKVNS